MDQEINYIIKEHAEWIQTGGMGGKQIEISNITFENEIIENQDLSVAIFFECKFMKCEFKNVDLSDVYFVGSCFEKCSFLNCMMSKADFSETTLVGGKIKECIAVKVNFYKSRLEAINIEKNDLRVINFTKAIMSNCYIIKSNISNGIFKETYIINTEFKEIEGIDECRVTNIYTDAERKIKIEGKDIIEWLGDNISQSK